MKRIQHPNVVKKAIASIDFSEIFSRDYSGLFELFEYQKDEFIIREDSLNQYLYFLLDGSVKCFSYSLNGKTQFISYLKPSESIGIVGTIWGQTANATVQAAAKCRCLALPLHHLRPELLEDNRFLRYLCRQLGDTLYNANRYLQVTHCTSAESKLASLILAAADGDLCRVNLSSSAEFIGTTYRHVLRMLSKFCADGILEKDGRNYIIRDLTALTLYSEDSYDYIVSQHIRP